MAYCEHCGLSSCYMRGGYCQTETHDITAVRDAIGRNLAVKVKWRSAGWNHTTLGHQYNYPSDSDGWIEVVW